MSKFTKHTHISLSFEEWEKAFKPITNSITPYSAFDGLMFETYGSDLHYVMAMANRKDHVDRLKVWTLVTGDSDDEVIVDGYHLVNRIGYFITQMPGKDGSTYEVTLN